MDVNIAFQLRQIRNKLNLKSAPWDNLPDDLLYLAFIPTGLSIYTKYPLKNNDILEFIGDAVLDLIIAQYLSSYHLNDYNCILAHFVSNKVLTCIMRQRFLCSPIVNVIEKACADRFESIIGAMYYYFYYLQNRDDAIYLIAQWYYNTFNIEVTLNNIIDNGKTNCSGDLKICNINRSLFLKFDYDPNINIDYSKEDEDYINVQKERLKLPSTLEKISNDFFMISLNSQALKNRNITNSVKILNQLQLKYGFNTNTMLIFLGTIVLKMLITNHIFDLIINGEIINSYQAHLIREKLTTSNVLLTLTYIYRRFDQEDMFSILGSLYYYLFNLQNDKFALQVINGWFIENWLPILKNPPLLNIPSKPSTEIFSTQSLNLNVIREQLDLNIEPLNRIPKDLLIISYNSKYQIDRALFYFIGVPLFELFQAQILSSYLKFPDIERPNLLTPTVIYDLMVQRNLCSNNISQHECLSRFIDMVGIIFYYFDYIEHLTTVVDLVSKWLTNIFDFETLINQYNNIPHKLCKSYRCNYPLVLKSINYNIDINLDRQTSITVNNFRQSLLLTPELMSVPDDLLALILSKNNLVNLNQYLERYQEKYGFTNSDIVLYLGQELSSLLITCDLYDLILDHTLSIDQAIQRRKAIDYYTNYVKLAKTSTLLKIYANRIPNLIWLIIGTFYYYLNNMQNNGEAFFIIRTWFIKTWPNRLAII